VRSTASGGGPKPAPLSRRNQRIVALARRTVTAQPHQIQRLSQAFQKMNLTPAEQRLASQAAQQHGRHLQSKQQGLRGSVQGVVEAAGFGGLAHPIRRAENPGGSMEFPGFGNIGKAARAAGELINGGRAAKAVREMQFPAEMPHEVRASAHRLAQGLDKPQLKALRAQQEKLYSAERGKRAKVAEAALKKHAGTPQAIRIAKSKLGGELPKVDMRGALGDLGEQDLNHLRGYVHTHQGLGLYDKINVEDSLEKTIAGRPPTERDRLLLHRVFGKEFVNRIEQPTLGTRLARGAAEVANVPRSIESSFDVSAPLRQGLVAMARHPGMTAKNIKPMLGAFKDQGSYDKLMAEISRRPNYHRYHEAGLAITDTHSGMAADREEFFPSNLAEKIPLAGHGVKASGRAYHGFLAKTRADMFDKHLASATKAGYDAEDPRLQKSLATFINSATGRGDIGKLAPASRALSAAFFSPRLLASRINFLNPAYYARLHPYARQQAIRSAAQLAAFVTGILETAHAAGAHVEIDPRSTDWAKIRVGNTRIDLLGGFQPVIRTAAQLSTGERKAANGDLVPLGHGPGQSSRLDVATRFLRGKLAPVPSTTADFLEGQTFIGGPVTAKGEAAQRLIPFGAQDAADVYRNGGHSLAGAAGAFGLSAFGAGVQSYKPNSYVPKAQKNIDKFEKTLTEAVQKAIGKNAQMPPAVRLVLDREQARAEARAELRDKLGRKLTTLDRFKSDVTFLMKQGQIKPDEARSYIQHAEQAKPWQVRSALAELGSRYFDPNGEIASLRHELRAKGIDLPNLHRP
jgi:hypothetical protein